jgi:hypothetical protein
MRPADDAPSVRHHRNGVDLALVATEDRKLGTAARIPNSHGFVTRPADDAPPVRRHRNTPDYILVPTEDSQFGCALRVPKAHRPVI